MKTEIYWNLHKHLFSVRQRGRVIEHAERVYLTSPEFVVREAGRQRVIREGRKNVHAFVRGIRIEDRSEGIEAFHKRGGYHDYTFARYDPYDNCDHHNRGMFRLACVIGEIFVDDEMQKCIKMVHAYIHDGKPQLKVKLGEPDP